MVELDKMFNKEGCSCGDCRACDPHYEQRLVEWEKHVDPNDVDLPLDGAYGGDEPNDIDDEASGDYEEPDDKDEPDIPI